MWLKATGWAAQRAHQGWSGRPAILSWFSLEAGTLRARCYTTALSSTEMKEVSSGMLLMAVAVWAAHWLAQSVRQTAAWSWEEGGVGFLVVNIVGNNGNVAFGSKIKAKLGFSREAEGKGIVVIHQCFQFPWLYHYFNGEGPKRW